VTKVGVHCLTSSSLHIHVLRREDNSEYEILVVLVKHSIVSLWSYFIKHSMKYGMAMCATQIKPDYRVLLQARTKWCAL
jgi:hypothetical protein